MNDLRVILLILGLVVVLGIYLYESFRERQVQRSRTVQRRTLDPVLPRRVPEPRADVDGEEAEPDAAPAPSAGPARIIVLHVIAPDGSAAFRGPDILAALDAAGLRFGAMNIFHCHSAHGRDYEQPLFSAASMHEPGQLDPEQLEQGPGARGLALFMCVPAPAPATEVFDLMVDAARTIAGILDGRLCGPDRRDAGEADIEALRNSLA